MERKIYLVFSDNLDAVCKIKGYLHSTEEEVRAYCADLNRDKAAQETSYVWMELPHLTTYEREKSSPPDSERRDTADKESASKPVYLSAGETAEQWGVSLSFVCRAAKEGRIPGAAFLNGKWQIPAGAEPLRDKRTSRKEGYISLAEAAEKWGVSRSFALSSAKEGRIPGAEFLDGKWHIPKGAEPLMDKRVSRRDGYISSEAAAEKWDSSPDVVGRFCREGRIPGAVFVDGYWHIPEDVEKPIHKRMARKKGFISPTRAAEQWGVSPSFVCKAAKEGRISGAAFLNGKWHIPEDAEKPARRRGKRKE